MPRVALINPNTSRAITDRMVGIARKHAGAGLSIAGLTAPFGAPLITTPEQLEMAREAVMALRGDLAGPFEGAIVSAFGDPGLEELRRALAIPVAGIAEAGMLEAAIGGRRFAVVTPTADLVPTIDAKARHLGLQGSYAGAVPTRGEPIALTADPAQLEAALAAAIEQALAERCAAAVVIGGGPLAVAASALALRFPVPIIEPVPAAVRWLLRRLAAARP